eukprot:2848596-Prymnesium_polylepis.1
MTRRWRPPPSPNPRPPELYGRAAHDWPAALSFACPSLPKAQPFLRPTRPWPPASSPAPQHLREPVRALPHRLPCQPLRSLSVTAATHSPVALLGLAAGRGVCGGRETR